MTKVEKYTQDAIAIANDNSHGYSQENRWGPDYDCSSLVITVVNNSGIPVKSKGATYTGNMYGAFTSCGFKDVTRECNLNSANGMKLGDILLNHSCHTAIYIGSCKIVHARTSEGNCMCGDQSGNEIRTQSYWNYPWDCVLRYVGDDSISNVCSESPTNSAENNDNIYYQPNYTCNTGNNKNYPEILKFGDVGNEVKEMQAKLNALGYNCGEADGEFGSKTLEAVKKFQSQKSLEDDGEAGPLTLSKLYEYYKGFTGKDSAIGIISGTTIPFSADASVPTGEAPTGTMNEPCVDTFRVGDVVMFSGDKHYIGADFAIGTKCKPGMAKITSIKLSSKHPFHLIRVANQGSTVYGWVDIDTVKKV